MFSSDYKQLNEFKIKWGPKCLLKELIIYADRELLKK